MGTVGFELRSNGKPLETGLGRLGWLTPSMPDQPIDALQAQLTAQGYLWLRGLLPRAAVLDLRRRYFTTLAETGEVAVGSDPVEGLYSGADDARGLKNKKLVEFTHSAVYEAFCLRPELVGFFTAVLGDEVYLHKRKLVRDTKPGDPNCTGAHYDLVYLRGGTDTVLTAWIPLGDTPAAMGGLVYLEGSDAVGRRLEREFGEANPQLTRQERINAFRKGGWLTRDLAELADRYDTRWLIADYEAGDVVVHTAYMVHASTENRDPAGRMRLSTDIRYQRLREEIDARWANRWTFDDML